ncbi:MAG: aminotransferase class V [Rhizobiales bacterium 62-17]|nr:aminotransferase class V-fold PLP-dependent enzyme [Hyphomicrobiales bacterium]OJY02148.1 MAG: aminotransferase class V [Rhizobiales bacterium 62-17]
MQDKRPPTGSAALLGAFRHMLAQPDLIGRLQSGLIGNDAVVDGPFGEKLLVYADYVASGRALLQIETFVLQHVLPYYANSHTEASYCGGRMTQMRREARGIIGECCGATDEHAVIFAGSGATAGINRLVTLLGVHQAVAAGERVHVIIGPYEHHSNILPWRESGARMTEIAESPDGGPDLDALDAALHDAAPNDLVICAFSAASNVTGIVTDVAAVTRRVKAAGARMVWDYAGAGPYLPIAMSPAGAAEIDAIVVSPHKFIGGPGASGILIVRRDAVVVKKPSWPGGGTVRFVSPSSHDYSDSLEAREEAGTPNVIGDIRAALAFMVKAAIGDDVMRQRNTELTRRAIAAWQDQPCIELLGPLDVPRLPIFSFRVRDGKEGFLHQQLVTRLLSDRFGIQARGGCACAGPYVHRLLSIDEVESEKLRQDILAGREIEKPGFIRLNFSVLLPDEKVEFILQSVLELARSAPQYVSMYACDTRRAIFSPKEDVPLVSLAS